MVNSAWEICGSVRFGIKNLKSQGQCWSDGIKFALKRNEAGWADVLGANKGIMKERCIDN